MRFRLLAVAALGCLGMLPATASATHVQCGSVITQETVLDSDVVCTAADPVGLVIGGDNFTLWLAGHTIQGADAAGSDGIADDGSVHTGVTIRGGAGGAISGFADGIDLDVAQSKIMKVGVNAIDVGVATRGNGNEIYRATVDMGTTGFSGVSATGDDNYLWGNSVTGGDDGIVVTGERPRLVNNRVDGCAFDGIIVSGYTDGMIAWNSVTNCDIGFTPSGTGMRIQANFASGNCLGMVIDDTAAFVRRNQAHDNCATGILILHPGVTVANNRTNSNLDYGIDAPEGTIDGGGNVAGNNGILDCLVVVCTPPPPPT